MPRFVLLSHDWPTPHFDLLLEMGDTARTWRAQHHPHEQRNQRLISLPDHRQLYLDYEGEVGGGRGRVARVDFGEYEIGEWGEYLLCGTSLLTKARILRIDDQWWLLDDAETGFHPTLP